MKTEFGGEMVEVSFWRIENSASGCDLGVFAGRNEAEAIDCMLWDMGASDETPDPDLVCFKVADEDLEADEREYLIGMWQMV